MVLIRVLAATAACLFSAMVVFPQATIRIGGAPSSGFDVSALLRSSEKRQLRDADQPNFCVALLSDGRVYPSNIADITVDGIAGGSSPVDVAGPEQGVSASPEGFRFFGFAHGEGFFSFRGKTEGRKEIQSGFEDASGFAFFGSITDAGVIRFFGKDGAPRIEQSAPSVGATLIAGTIDAGKSGSGSNLARPSRIRDASSFMHVGSIARSGDFAFRAYVPEETRPAAEEAGFAFKGFISAERGFSYYGWTGNRLETIRTQLDISVAGLLPADLDGRREAPKGDYRLPDPSPADRQSPYLFLGSVSSEGGFFFAGREGQVPERSISNHFAFKGEVSAGFGFSFAADVPGLTPARPVITIHPERRMVSAGQRLRCRIRVSNESFRSLEPFSIVFRLPKEFAVAAIEDVAEKDSAAVEGSFILWNLPNGLREGGAAELVFETEILFS